MKKQFLMLGVLILAISGGFLVSKMGDKFEYNENFKETDTLIIDTDMANIKLTSNDSELNVKYNGKKSFFKKTSFKIGYSKGEVKITGSNAKWFNMIPSMDSRGEMIVNIPPNTIRTILVRTGRGNIEVEGMSDMNNLTIATTIGTVKVNSFEGKTLNINGKNGSIEVGEVDAEVHIKNAVGKIKEITFLTINGVNTIESSNGTVKLILPSDYNIHDYGLKLETKNGKIADEQMKLPKNSIRKKAAGQQLDFQHNEKNKLSVNVSVGSIVIN